MGKDSEGRFDPVLPLQSDLRGGYRREFLEFLQLRFNQFLPNGPSGQAAITDDNVHNGFLYSLS